MTQLSDETPTQVEVEPRALEDVTVPERDLDEITATFRDVQEGDSVSLTVGYDNTAQEVELIVDEIDRDGGEFNEQWEEAIKFITKVVAPDEATEADEYLQIFVAGVLQDDTIPPWFVHSYRVERSANELVTFVDPETGIEYPTSFAHGWVIEAKNYFGSEFR